MNQLLTWLSMGEYSIYVWPAYGLLCTVLIMNWLGMMWQRKKTRQKLQQWFKRQQS